MSFDLTTSQGPQEGIDALIGYLEQITGCFASPTEPPAGLLFPYMWWADLTNGLLKQRNANNTAWIVRGKLNSSGYDFWPAGAFLNFGSPDPPNGFLVRNGAALDRTTYANLYNAIKTSWNRRFWVTLTDDIVHCSNHGFVTGDIVDVWSTASVGMLPSPLAIDTPYYVNRIDANTLTLHSTAVDATANTNKIDIISNGSGLFTIAPISTFMLPEGRAEFERGWDMRRGVDAIQIPGTITNGSPNITALPSGAIDAIFIGQAVSGMGIPANATVSAIFSDTSIQISANATASGTVVCVFTGRLWGSWQQDTLKDHNHSILTVLQAYAGTGYSMIDRILVANGTIGGGNPPEKVLTGANIGGYDTRPRNYPYLPCIKY